MATTALSKVLSNLKFKPPNGGPVETPVFVNAAEKKMLAKMTDGKLNKTKYGIDSAYMEASTSGSYRSSSPSQSGTQSGSGSSSGSYGGGVSPGGGSNSNLSGGGSNSGSRGTTGMQQGSNSYNSSSNSASRSGSTANRSGLRSPSDSQLSRSTQARDSGGLRSPSDSQLSDPFNARAGETSSRLMRNANARSMQGNAVTPGNRVTDVFGPTYAQDPSIAGRLRSPVAPGSSVTDVFGPTVRMDPGIVARMNPPSTGTPAMAATAFGPRRAPNLPGFMQPDTPSFNPASIADYQGVVPKQFTDQVPTGPASVAGRPPFGRGNGLVTAGAPENVSFPGPSFGRGNVNGTNISGTTVAQDPSIAGRLALANRPGAGVPDLPIRGNTVAMNNPPQNGQVTDVFGPNVRMDPGIIAQMNPPGVGSETEALTRTAQASPAPFRNGVNMNATGVPPGAGISPRGPAGQPTNLLRGIPGFNGVPNVPRQNPLRQAISGGYNPPESSNRQPWWYERNSYR